MGERVLKSPNLPHFGGDEAPHISQRFSKASIFLAADQLQLPGVRFFDRCRGGNLGEMRDKKQRTSQKKGVNSQQKDIGQLKMTGNSALEFTLRS